MVSASLYITLCSAKNRLLQRLRRLREPRYLIGAVVGAAYLYFSFFARMRGRSVSVGPRRRGGGGPSFSLDQFGRMATAAGGIALFIVAALAWLLPTNSGMLDFSDAEVDMLFTAPVPRRALILHRLMRAQIGLLFTALITSLVYPSAALGRLRWAVAMWIMLTTARVYFTGVTLARGAWTARPRTGGARGAAWAPVAVSILALAVVGLALFRAFATAPATFEELAERTQTVVSTGAASVILWPFVTMIRPLGIAGLVPFLVSLAPALLVLAITTLWVLQTDAALQDVAEDASQKRAAKATSASTPAMRARGGFTLAPSGRAEAVFLWKNATAMVRATSGAALFRYFVPLILIAVGISTALMSAREARGLAATLCTIGMGIAAFCCVLGPQIVRTDLRSDLRHLEVLKTWPVRAADVVRGEMLCPAVVLTSVVWLAVACAAMLSSAAFPQLSATWRISGAFGAFVIAPAFITAQLAVQNAAAVFFPAWVPQGDQRPRGLDAMGQRLIMLAGVMLAVLVFFLPGAIAAGVLWFAFYRWIGAAIVPIAALVCTAIVAIEVLAATEMLGPAYERLDILSVERAE